MNGMASRNGDHPPELGSRGRYARLRMTPGELAQAILASRKLREGVFGDIVLSSDPAWDMLLRVFIAGEDRQGLPVSSLCAAAPSPASTARRWVLLVESEGHFKLDREAENAADPVVVLTAQGRDRMQTILENLADSWKVELAERPE